MKSLNIATQSGLRLVHAYIEGTLQMQPEVSAEEDARIDEAADALIAALRVLSDRIAAMRATRFSKERKKILAEIDAERAAKVRAA